MSAAAERLGAVRGRLSGTDFGALVVRDVANLTYLSAFDDVWDEEPSSLLFVTPSGAMVLTDSRYEEAAGHAADDSEWQVVVCDADPWDRALTFATELGIERVAVESCTPLGIVEKARARFAGEIVAVDGWMEALRAVKDSVEIARIVSAQRVTDDALDHVLGMIAPGMTEAQIALELEFFMRSHGSQGVAFAPIVASGPNSALPHAHPGSRMLEVGDFLKMDFGARVDGYCADMTRTVVMGSASPRQREIYETVLAANLAGIAAIAPGATGRDVDAAARAVIAAAGYGANFRHGLGHGVGIEVHELPTLSTRGEAPLTAGNVVTVEPGIYVPGFGGVRIEDLVVVEGDGARVLTRSAKDLIEL